MTATFNPASFTRLKAAEENHFWFRTRREWILRRIRRYAPSARRIVEVGCGTGNVGSYLAHVGGYAVTGCEYHASALRISWDGFTRVQGDAARLPFRSGTFDVAGLFDVIEHFDDDNTVLSEAARVVGNRGFVIVTVPARQDLWSATDEKAMHKRRYTQQMLSEALRRASLDVVHTEHFFLSLYLPAKITRDRRKAPDNQFRISPLMNTMFNAVTRMELAVSDVISLPIGTSLMGIARNRS